MTKATGLKNIWQTNFVTTRYPCALQQNATNVEMKSKNVLSGNMLFGNIDEQPAAYEHLCNKFGDY
ncbi:hypothetical protein HGH92_23775 [Chitinophaga varians]|uniref:Uncharacterized protein n=1 Tax=Chitinophaga varians TaxID=2202339 RepID=A0A847S1R3_9BACT|nr:hypothetical protein [Chitinophaga varians]NLR67345.1 hypothetical protein [Chitinophaga varians]